MAGSTADDIRKKMDEFQRKIESFYSKRGRIFRVMWILVAITIILAGLAMTVLPGPAVIVIPLGFAMLGVQFAWARKVLDFTVDKGEQVEKRYRRLGGPAKLLLWATFACIVAAAVSFVLLR